MKKIFLKSLFLSFVFVGLFCLFSYAMTQDLGLDYAAQTGLSNQDIRITIANIIRIALGMLGLVAVVIVLWGGFMWMTAGGDENRVADAKKILINGFIGLVIILTSYAIVSFVVKNLTDAFKESYPSHCYNQECDGDEDCTTDPSIRPNCGGSCPSCRKEGPNTIIDVNRTFTIQSRPSGGFQCIANYHPVISFTKGVDLNTINNSSPKRISIKKGGVEIAGEWKYLLKTSGETDQKQIYFSGTNDCGDGKSPDCLEGNTEYTIEFYDTTNILSVNKDVFSCGNEFPNSPNYKCGLINFKTGSEVDLQSPTIELLSLPEAVQGDSVRFFVRMSDDVAIGYASLNVISSTLDINQLYSSSQLSDCVKEKDIEIIWPTSNFPTGTYDLLATGYDKVPRSTTTEKNILLKPKHCINGVKDGDETGIDCGGSCGRCDGIICERDEDCASGACINNICVPLMRIISIDPSKGEKGDFVGIFGRYFGNTPGKVYFANKENPSSANTSTDWVEAEVTTCGTNVKNWSNNQIVVTVPDGFYQSGAAIMVEKPGDPRQVANTIKDGVNNRSNRLRFVYESNNNPSLCSVSPISFSSFQDGIRYVGKKFGSYDVGDRAYLSTSNDESENLVMTIKQGTWGQPMSGGLYSIVTQAGSTEDGNFLTYIKADGVKSNSLSVQVRNMQDPNAPTVERISPVSGAKGEYITITGKNFGNSRGSVRFYKRVGGLSLATSPYFPGDFMSFMSECAVSDVWTDGKIIVKFPTSFEENSVPTDGNYEVIVFKQNGQSSILRNDITFELGSGEPGPGICKIVPSIGPIGTKVKVYGQNFGTATENLMAYFWKQGASNINYNVRATSSIELLGNVTKGQVITSTVPTSAITGEMILMKNGNLDSNPLNFSVFDCVKNNERCLNESGKIDESGNFRCCTEGSDKGMCVPSSSLCSGEIQSTGYKWRFTTGEFPDAPKVVEQCGNNITPSPAPSLILQYQKHRKACENALITIGFTTRINSSTANINNILIYKCIKEPGGNPNVCAELSPDKYSYFIDQPLRTLSGGQESDRDLVVIKPTDGIWEPGFYQVILKKDIKSLGVRAQKLEATLPCDGQIGNISDTAYCYTFGIVAEKCELSGVVINPNEYWTGVLENPIMKRIDKKDLEEITTESQLYTAEGKSNIDCLLMNTDGYDYAWFSQRPTYAEVNNPANKNTTIEAKANTVAEGLNNPDDSVNIISQISTTTGGGSISATGTSPLKIDLSDPKIIEYAPKCLTACPNAEINVKFDKQMSSNILQGGFTLERCNNVDCSQKEPQDIKRIDPWYSGSQIIGFIIMPSSSVLAVNAYYKVNIASNSVFTIASTTNLGLPGKPYKTDFSWIFGTKDKICDVSKVEVSPLVFNAFFIGQRGMYKGNVFSAPDECNTKGQKINANNYDWLWNVVKPEVAIKYDTSIKGSNPFCTSNCLRKGSTFTSASFDYNLPMCGNGVIEAGEDCEISNSGACANPFNQDCSCTEKCLLRNKSKTGSCTTTASGLLDCRLCGDGIINPSDEDCDTNPSIPSGPLIVTSSLNCNTRCLHTGTPLSATWCAENHEKFHDSGSFVGDKSKFETACKNSVSQCGNGKVEPGEECEVDESNCTKFCLFENRKVGSSLFNNTPSVCGDGVYTGDEDRYCETTSTFFGYNASASTSPWVLVEAVGLGYNPSLPKQSTDITGQARNSGKTGTAQFNLVCGYTTDEECVARTPAGATAPFGVGKNSCCYQRPTKLSTYPEKDDVCPNTEIKISFDKPIDATTLQGNLLIAREYPSDNTQFCTGTQIIKSSDILSYSHNDLLPWYKKIWQITISFFQKFFGVEKAVAQWCTGETIGTSDVKYNAEEDSFDIVIDLEKPLVGSSTTYKILLLPGIKDDKGVSIGKRNDGKPHQFTFTTWQEPGICTVGKVEISPSSVFFTKSNSSTILTATAVSQTFPIQFIQPVDSYFWTYVWSKDGSVSFGINEDLIITTNTVISTNQNGEGNVFATVSTTKTGEIIPPGNSKITVNLCENPWPPFEVNGNKVWPFEDIAKNNDGFDFGYKTREEDTGFTGTSFISDSFTKFSTHYCADAGTTGKKDDLPYMKPAINSVGLEPEVIKYFLLTNDKNADAIGIKVFKNLDYLNLTEWLISNSSTMKGNFNFLKVDGYEAAVDGTGNNVYVAALNISSTVYSNIYLFSLNLNANNQTKQVFDQILTNLKFNIDFLEEHNLKMCASGYNWKTKGTLPEGFCNTDLDCLKIPDKPTCLNQKEKMQRNYQRIQDARFVSTSLTNYYNDSKNDNKYPTITQSYLPNRAMSVWQSSWVELGSKLGKPLPLDPINKLAPGGTCFMSSTDPCIQNSDCGTTTVGLTNQVGYWAGENNFNDNIVSTTKRNNAIGQGVTFAPGVGRDFAFNFPKGFEKITIKHQESYNDNLNQFALSFWFKPTEQTPAILIKKGGWSDTASNNTLGGFMVEYNKLSFAGSSPVANNGTIRFAIFPSSTDPLANKQYFAIDTQNPLTLNKWHHVLVRYYDDGTKGDMYLVVDGTIYRTIKTGTSSPSRNVYTTGSVPNLKIGQNKDDIIIGEGLKGQIDEIYLYSLPWTNEAIPDFNKRFENICHLHDLTTGWSAEDLRLSFACADKSMAYSYNLKNDGNYVIRGTGENDNLSGGAWLNVWNKFGFDGNKFVLGNFCESPIISNSAGLCGNGVVNPGEACDPPGTKEYTTTKCPPPASNPNSLLAGVKLCNDKCNWSTQTATTCRAAVGGVCGDGIVQTKAGELCDDGPNNGKLGFCGTNCRLATNNCGNGTLNTGELCDWKKTCTDSRLCFIDNDLKIKWGLTKEESCNTNCRSYGPYCGDGKWESDYEDCDGNQSCTIETTGGAKISGTKYCSSECQADNSQINGLISFWNFNLKEGALPGIFQFKDAKNNNSALCGVLGSICPVTIDGRNSRNKGLDFSQDSKASLVVYETTDPNKRLIRDEMSIELWIKPYSGNPTAARILEKGGANSRDIISNKRGGYGIEFNPNYFPSGYQRGVNKLRWIVWNNNNTIILDTPSFSADDFNKWQHVVATYKKIDSTRSQTQLFLNGALVRSTTIQRLMEETTYPLCIGAKCKRSGSSYSVDEKSSNFEGLMDDVSFYDRVLTLDEIRSHYNEESSGYCVPFSNSIFIENPDCGDGVWQPENNEECDAGAANGTPCEIPTGFSSCSWCSSVCKLQWNSCSAGFVANNDHECPGMFIRTSIPIWSGM